MFTFLYYYYIIKAKQTFLKKGDSILKLISMADDRNSFQICAISGTRKFNIAEMLFLKQGEYADYSERKYSYVEYKIRVLVNKFGTYCTYTVLHIRKKDAWYIKDNCAELLENLELSTNKYQYL